MNDRFGWILECKEEEEEEERLAIYIHIYACVFRTHQKVACMDVWLTMRYHIYYIAVKESSDMRERERENGQRQRVLKKKLRYKTKQNKTNRKTTKRNTKWQLGWQYLFD